MNRLGLRQHSGFSIMWLIGGLVSLVAAFWLLSQPDSTQVFSKLILPSPPSTRGVMASSTSNSICQGTNCRNPVMADAAVESSTPPEPAMASQDSAAQPAPLAVPIPSIKSADSGTTKLKDLALPSQQPSAGAPTYYQESGHDGGGAASGSRDTSEHSGSDGGSPTVSGDHGGTSDGGKSDGGDHH
ncbi:MAG TPA: hypothetical protein VF932_12805 [Anaerolineae bacterium]